MLFVYKMNHSYKTDFHWLTHKSRQRKPPIHHLHNKYSPALVNLGWTRLNLPTVLEYPHDIRLCSSFAYPACAYSHRACALKTRKQATKIGTIPRDIPNRSADPIVSPPLPNKYELHFDVPKITECKTGHTIYGKWLQETEVMFLIWTESSGNRNSHDVINTGHPPCFVGFGAVGT